MVNNVLSNTELINTLIVDLNNIPKELIAGQFVQACCIVSSMAQKLLNLRNTIDDELKNKTETIEQLKEALRNSGVNLQEATAEEFVNKYCKKDGAE